MPYANYQWEVFLHAPMRIADNWPDSTGFRTPALAAPPFDPTGAGGFDSGDASRHWKHSRCSERQARPRGRSLQLDVVGERRWKTAYDAQVAQWANPFNPMPWPGCVMGATSGG